MILLSHDISSQALLSLQPNKPRVTLVSYAAGDEIYFRNQNALQESAINKGIDVVINYRQEYVDPAFIHKHADVFQHKIGAGYWLWKPWMILHTMQQMQDNEILIYSDVNYVFVRPITDLLTVMQNHDILIVEHPSRTREQESLQAALDGMGCSSDSCRKGLNTLSGFMLLKNNATTRAFIQEWLLACEVREYLIPGPGKDPNSALLDHKPDQSTLGLLAYKHRDKVKMLSYQYIRERYIMNTYRKVGTDYLTKDSDIFKYSVLGRIQYNLSNSFVFVKLREMILRSYHNFPWRQTYFSNVDLEPHLKSPEAA